GVNGGVGQFVAGATVNFGPETFGGTPGSVIQKGPGTTILRGKNTYTGATQVTAGTLQVNSTIASSSSVTVFKGATLVEPSTTHFLVTGAPSSFPASGPNTFDVTATAADVSNATHTGYLGTVHFTSTDGAATLPADYTFVAADAGKHVFSITLNTQGA